jgi:hypothetical protein
MDGLRAKAKVVAFCYAPEEFGEAFERETTDMRSIHSLVLDLLNPPAAA